jgi:hypothetical protein
MSREGFTLAELVVAVAVSLFLSSLLISYTAGSRQRTELFIESAKISELVLRAKALAISTFDQDDPPPPCAYGVRVSYAAQEYALIRYEKQSAGVECPPFVNAGDALDLSRREDIEVFRPSTGVRLVAIVPVALWDVLFEPPDPRTLLFRRNDRYDDTLPSRAVCLRTQDGGSELRLNVSRSGQVSFENAC